MERMAWVAEMIDRITGPTRRMTRALWAFHASTKAQRSNIHRLSEGHSTFRKMLNGGTVEAYSMRSAVGWLTAGVVAAGAAFGVLSYQIGRTAFENFAFKESALATGAALWGSTEAAAAMFKQASELARLTPFNVREVATAFNRIGAAGFSAEEAPVVFQGLSDIAAISGRGAEAIGSLTLAFSQIMGKGRLMGQELIQITEAAGGAVAPMKLFAKYSELMGRPVTLKDMENGLIDARTAIMGVMMIAKDLGGGVLGNVSIEQSKTLAGLWSNLEDTITNLWLTMDISSAPWFGTVKSILTNVISLLDTSNASGQRLQAVFGRVFETVFGQFASLGSESGLSTLITWLDRAAAMFETVWGIGTQAFSGLWEGVSSVISPVMDLFNHLGVGVTYGDMLHATFLAVGRVLGFFVTGIGVAIAIVTPFVALLGVMVNLFTDLVNLIAKVVVGGFSRLFTGASWENWKDFGRSIATDLDEGFTGGLKIQSPSKVFEDHGKNVVRGFNRGVESIPGMESTLGDDLASGAVRVGGLGVGSAGGVQVAMTLNIDNTGHLDGASIAQQVMDVLPSRLAELFDRMAAEQGVA